MRRVFRRLQGSSLRQKKPTPEKALPAAFPRWCAERQKITENQLLVPSASFCLGCISTSVCPVASYRHGRTVVPSSEAGRQKCSGRPDWVRGRHDEMLALSFSV